MGLRGFLRGRKQGDWRAVRTAEDIPFLDFAARNFDPDWYLERNPDVAASNTDPFTHWLKHGLHEGRTFGAELDIRRLDAGQTAPAASVEKFEYGGSTFLIRRRDRREDDEFITFAKNIFDPEWYLSAYPDVRIAEFEPWRHWITHGLWEMRRPGPGTQIALDKTPGNANGRVWRFFRYEGRSLAAQVPLDRGIVNQILDQGVIDPAVLAPGALALASLLQVDAPDLVARYGIKTEELFSKFKESPRFIFIMNRVGIGGAEKYLANVVDVLLRNGERSIGVIVTDQHERDTGEWRSLSIMRPLADLDILFWPDACGAPRAYDRLGAFDSSGVLARLLNALRPEHVFVSNSCLGFEAISRFGRGLSQFAAIYCAYYVLGRSYLGSPHALRFPRKTAPFAVSVTDNRPVADFLQLRYGVLHKKGIRVLDLRREKVSGDEFSKRLAARKKRFARKNRKSRWAWILAARRLPKGDGRSREACSNTAHRPV